MGPPPRSLQRTRRPARVAVPPVARHPPRASALAARTSGGNLGAFDDVGVLASAAQDEFIATLSSADAAATATTTLPPPNEVANTCEASLTAADGELGSARYDATATVDEDGVAVVVFDLASGDGGLYRLYVVDADCGVLTRADF